MLIGRKTSKQPVDIGRLLAHPAFVFTLSIKDVPNGGPLDVFRPETIWSHVTRTNDVLWKFRSLLRAHIHTVPSPIISGYADGRAGSKKNVPI